VAVQVWIGEKPEHPQERRAIIALASSLERLDGLYLILANFSVGGRNIDLVVIKPDGIFIIELKYCDGKVFGDVNGPWFVEGSNGERKRLNPGRKNPYNQVISYYYSLINFLNEARPKFLSPQKAATVDFRTCRRLVVIAPTIQEGSQVETDWKVDLKGLDQLPPYLLAERSSEINLSEEEMLAIPEMLHCIHWSEISVLIGSGAANEAHPTERTAVPTEAAAQPLNIQPASSQRWAQLQQLQALFSTWSGRAMAAMALLIVALAGLLYTTTRPTTPPFADQPASFAASTSLPAGGADAGVVAPVSNCTWSGFQAVGRRRDTAGESWETVGVTGVAQDLAPEVIVTLEEVRYCDGQIAISWGVRNNTSDLLVQLPFDNENIVVRDSLGNTYPIAEAAKTKIDVPAGNRGEATIALVGPVNLNAATLVVQLKQQPFGEATWLIPIDAP
jgi:hypothetical protein